MNRRLVAIALTVFAGCLFAQDQPTANAGKQAEQRSCIAMPQLAPG